MHSSERPLSGPPSKHTNSDEDEASVQTATRLSARLIYEVIRRDGEEELERPTSSLVWSGMAAGIVISFSVWGEAVLRTYLPDTPHAFLVENLGYSLGFLIVILGRMQLFTENTITTVLPVMHRQSWSCLVAMLRLWTLVLLANVVGAFVAGFFLSLPDVVSDAVQASLLELSSHAVGMGAWQGFVRGIPAGVLVASIVWMMPSSQSGGFFIILGFTWMIAAGDLTHIIAGSVEMAYLVWQGQLGAYAAIVDFFLPVLAGNIVGGTAIFTMLAWGQVKNEVAHGTGTSGSG
ncbi:formate/nitrite transporter family protein [uncultured Tateyamaria sp.]|uniref:formate/nitrite transporter family protein n=1 Tax=uncultured Tateyamaria sp. TaxID=455651 RepID=UPI0026173B48|nr:formate/nitrite transporter family protein [uncultured Tateyamaria sp.]